MSEEVRRPFAGFPFLAKLVGAAFLDGKTYEDIADARTTIAQAIIVVVLAGLARALGTGHITQVLPFYVFIWCVSWATWVLIIYLVSTLVFNLNPLKHRFFKIDDIEPDWTRLTKTSGFAQVPLIFTVFGSINGLGTFLFIMFSVITLWQFVTMTIAAKHAIRFKSAIHASIIVASGFICSLAIQSAEFFL